jgi:hypothetical protein
VDGSLGEYGSERSWRGERLPRDTPPRGAGGRGHPLQRRLLAFTRLRTQPHQHRDGAQPRQPARDAHQRGRAPAGAHDDPRDHQGRAEKPEYGTAHFGKWHEAWGSTPGDHGYEYHNGGLPYPPPGHDPLTNPKDIEGITQLAEAFIEAQVTSGNPFYLVVSHHAVHIPIAALPATLDYYLQKPPGTLHANPTYAALTHDLDTGLGRILGKLDELQIRDETYVIYMSDNGGADTADPYTGNPLTSNLPLKSGKGTLWEGGVRVPFVVAGPGVVAGRVETGKAAVGWDLMPTILDWVGASHALPPDSEGESLRGVLEGTAGGGGCTSADDRTLVWHYPHGNQPHSAIRRQTCAGTFKLIHFWQSGQLQLYDLDSDLAEAENLAETEPALATELQQELSAYLTQVGSPCPNTDLTQGPRCPDPKPRCGLGYELPLLLMLPLLARRRRWTRPDPPRQLPVRSIDPR